MTSPRHVVWIIGLSLLVAQPALAQIPFGGKMGSSGAGFLIENEAVQKELKLTDEQVKKCKAINQELREKHQDDFEKLKGLKKEDRAEQLKEVMRAISEETMKALAGVLDPQQAKRLYQIDLQQRGPQAFTDPAIEKALKLSDDQKTQIKTLNDDAAKEIRDTFESAGGGKSLDLGKKMLAVRKETLERITAVLTDKQKQEWSSLTGKPFDLTPEGPGRNKKP
jgi:hypothetical protein